MRLATDLLIVGLLIGFISLVMKVRGDVYWSDPSQWNRNSYSASYSTTQEIGEQRESTWVTRYEQMDLVGSREIRTGVSGKAQGSLFGGVQQRYESHANYDDGGEQWGSMKDNMTYSLRVKDANGTEQDVEGLFPSKE